VAIRVEFSGDQGVLIGAGGTLLEGVALLQAAPPRTAPRIGRLLVGLVALYGLMRVVSTALWWLVSDVMRIQPAPLPAEELPAFITGFALFFAPLLYLSACALARRWLPLEPSRLMLYMGATFFCAALAEIAVDEAFVAVLGRPAWLYQVWPVHGGFTSAAGVAMWPLYGVFVYLLHGALRGNPRLRFLDNDMGKALLVAVDAMLLEVAANAFTLVGFRSFFFFYLVPDLHHFTTWEIFIPYILAGVVGMKLIAVLDRRKHRALIGLALQLAATVLVLRIF
jgi:hypothetical protein